MEDKPEQTPEPAPGMVARVSRRATARWDRLLSWVDRRARLSAWVGFVGGVIRTQGENRASLAAAGAAFWIVIALFPAVIAAVSIFGLIVGPEAISQALVDLSAGGTDSLSESLARQAQQVATTGTATLSMGVAVSLIVVLWSASNGTYNLVRAIRQSYGLGAEPYLKARLGGIVTAVVGVLGLGAFALVLSQLKTFDDDLGQDWQDALATVLIGLLGLALAAAILYGLYRFSIGRQRQGRTLLPGALGATVALWVLYELVSAVFAAVGRSSAAYGIAAGSVSALISVYMGSYVMLLGAIVNAHWRTDALFRRGAGATPEPATGDLGG